MVVIGIDPGIERTGIGIVKKEKNKLLLLYQKLITTPSTLSHEMRLKLIYDNISNILDNYEITNAAIEKIFFAKNVKTAISVSEVRGVLILACTLRSIPIFEYTPLQVKQSLSGYGRADKDQIKKLIKILLKLDKGIVSDDVADSIAIAITHINSEKLKEKLKKEVKL